MIHHVTQLENLKGALDKIGLGTMLREKGAALIKINLARPPEPEHPRTDPALLTQLIQYTVEHDTSCTLVEGADGFLAENIDAVGLSDVVETYNVQLIDLDPEEVETVIVGEDMHYLPKCLRTYPVRIGFPATSKRPDMTFSNNVKLFVGAVPRRMYQIGEPQSHRPRIHLDLHTSVANIYRAVMMYAPFQLFINGGKAMFEGRGEMEWDEVLVGDNAIEMDHYVLDKFDIDPPEYLRRLAVAGSKS